MIVLPHNGQLLVEWKHDTPNVSEYVIEWVSDGKIDWQRENKTTRQTVIKGIFFCFYELESANILFNNVLLHHPM